MKIGRIYSVIAAIGAWLLVSASPGFTAEFQEKSLSGRLQLSQNVQDETREVGAGSIRSTAAEYRIDTGDRITISVYQEPDLSVSDVRVKANGTIAYPLLGDLHVAGLTSRQLQELVTRKLLDGYLKKPSINVTIDSYRLYYIKGEVNRPGGYTFVDGLTVAKAVALAGGFTERASESRISLVREADPENPLTSVRINTAIEPGDVITVGESFF